MTRIASIDGIQRRYLHDEVAAKLRDLIISGELEPKSKVNENELAERFNISRTPMREAIKILSSEGLVDLLPNRGARVASITEGEIEEILEVVAGLEGVAGELACKKASAEAIAQIAGFTQDMLDAYHERDETAYFRLNQQIHQAILDAAGNATLRATYGALSSRIQRARYTAHKTDLQWERAVEDHKSMLAMLVKREGLALGAVMRAHVRSKKEVIAAAYGQ